MHTERNSGFARGERTLPTTVTKARPGPSDDTDDDWFVVESPLAYHVCICWKVLSTIHNFPKMFAEFPSKYSKNNSDEFCILWMIWLQHIFSFILIAIFKKLSTLYCLDWNLISIQSKFEMNSRAVQFQIWDKRWIKGVEGKPSPNNWIVWSGVLFSDLKVKEIII